MFFKTLWILIKLFFFWYSSLGFPFLFPGNNLLRNRPRGLTPINSKKCTSTILFFNDHEGTIHYSSSGLCTLFFFNFHSHSRFIFEKGISYQAVVFLVYVDLWGYAFFLQCWDSTSFFFFFFFCWFFPFLLIINVWKLKAFGNVGFKYSRRG